MRSARKFLYTDIVTKLLIQIPAWNEAETLPVTLASLPRAIPGVTEVEWLVIDDGSTDDTAAIASQHGVHHVVRNRVHLGLASSFARGLNACLELGADIIVNTDADNQYDGGDIVRLVAPILEGKADIVVGDRKPGAIPQFSFAKRILQRIGSWVASRAAGARIPDVTSGFRAFSRQAALMLNVVSEYTYTIETLIEAHHRGLAVMHVPVRTNPPRRKSRLLRGIADYVRRSIATIVRIYTMYRPLPVFLTVGSVLMAGGFGICVRFLYFFFTGRGGGHVQSLLLAVLLLVLGFQTAVMGLLADQVGHNRKLIEEMLWRMRARDVDEKARRPLGSDGSPNGDRR